MTMEWNPYHMGFAEHAAKKSKDRTQVGAALIGPGDEVLLTAFNGPPRGVRESDERRTAPEKYLFSAHAEANLISFAARHGIRTEGCSVFVTHHPCAACARSLIQAGIVCVASGGGQFSLSTTWQAEINAAQAMFSEAGVEMLRL